MFPDRAQFRRENNPLIEGGISIASFDGMLPSFNVAPNVDCSSAIWYTVNSARDNNSLLAFDQDKPRLVNGYGCSWRALNPVNGQALGWTVLIGLQASL